MRLSFNHWPTTQIYTLSLHDALPISSSFGQERLEQQQQNRRQQEPLIAWCLGLARGRRPLLAAKRRQRRSDPCGAGVRSEEHTSALQSQSNLVCRLQLEKKNRRLDDC